MENNLSTNEIINIEQYIEKIKNKLNNTLKNATYSEIIKYIEMLPKYYESDDSLFSWGFSYLNEYYKIIDRLNNINVEEIEKLKYKIYILYLKENYNKIVFTFDEFITFSKLLNITFSNYNPNRVRQEDKKTYKSGDDEIDYIVNKVIHDVLHSPHPNAYEIKRFKLNILLNILNTKSKILLEDEFNKIDLDDSLLKNTLSENRIKELKKKRN